MKTEVFNQLKIINDIYSEIDYAYHEIALRCGLSDSEFNVLYTLCQMGNGCPLSLAYKHNGTSRQTIESAVRKLEKKDIMYLRTAEGCRKSMWLTPRGKEFVEEKIVTILRMEKEILDSWEKEEVEDYLRLSQKYLDSLQQKKKEYFRSE